MERRNAISSSKNWVEMYPEIPTMRDNRTTKLLAPTEDDDPFVIIPTSLHLAACLPLSLKKFVLQPSTARPMADSTSSASCALIYKDEGNGNVCCKPKIRKMKDDAKGGNIKVAFRDPFRSPVQQARECVERESDDVATDVVV